MSDIRRAQLVLALRRSGVRDPALLEQLASDGVLVLPIGQAHGAQELVRIRKSGGSVESERLMPVRFVPLVAEKSKASVFSP